VARSKFWYAGVVAIGLTPVVFTSVGFDNWEARASSLDSQPVEPPAPSANRSPAGRTLADGAALVEGTIGALTFSYDDENGPRTNYELLVENVHAGSLPSPRLVLSMFGGFLPSGQFTTSSETPAFAEGQRCLLLLTNKSAFWSPIVPGYGFTIETVDGTDVVIGEEGHPLVSVGVLGPKFGKDKLVEGPSFDGLKMRPQVLLPASPSERLMDVVDAVNAIRAILKADGISLGGGLGPTKRQGTKWNETPLAGVGQ
jgi:hypothetical protein